MAITPKEALKITEAERDQVKDLESRIDLALKKEFPGYSNKATYSLDRDSRGGVSKRVRTEIIGRYQSAGWNVSYHSDQREGNWLSFTPREGIPEEEW